MTTAIRTAYKTHGVTAFYVSHGQAYRNPHEAQIQTILRRIVYEWGLNVCSVLDLACGSGEATRALQTCGCGQVEGSDPYTFLNYEKNTQEHCWRYSFEDIANGALEGKKYSLIVCSFALHLLDTSWFPALFYQLQQTCAQLLVLTPHKRPHIPPKYGYHLVKELRVARVRARLYSATTGTACRIFL